MKYVKSNRTAILESESRKITILVANRSKTSTRGVSLKKTKTTDKEILKHYLHITLDRLYLDSSQRVRKVMQCFSIIY